MDKPLSIRKEEFEQGLVQLINNSGLPSYIIEPIMKAYSLEVKELCRTQTENERQQYLEALKEQETKDEVIANEEEK